MYEKITLSVCFLSHTCKIFHVGERLLFARRFARGGLLF